MVHPFVTSATVRAMDPTTQDDPKLAVQVRPVERPAGTVSVALRPEAVRSAVEGLDRHAGPGAAPTFRRLVAGAEPFRLNHARGHLLRDVPVAELQAAFDELGAAWSAVDEHERLLFHIGAAMAPMSRALRHDPMTPRLETAWNHSYTHPERQAGWRHARWRARAARHVLMCALADRLVTAVRNGPPNLEWSRASAWRLMGSTVKPNRGTFERTPAGAYLFWPPPLHLRVSPAAPGEGDVEIEARVHAALAAMHHVHTVVALASAGYLTAQQGVSWLTGWVADCLTDWSSTDADRRAAWASAHRYLASFVTTSCGA